MPGMTSRYRSPAAWDRGAGPRRCPFVLGSGGHGGGGHCCQETETASDIHDLSSFLEILCAPAERRRTPRGRESRPLRVRPGDTSRQSTLPVAVRPRSAGARTHGLHRARRRAAGCADGSGKRRRVGEGEEVRRAVRCRSTGSLRHTNRFRINGRQSQDPHGHRRWRAAGSRALSGAGAGWSMGIVVAGAVIEGHGRMRGDPAGVVVASPGHPFPRSHGVRAHGPGAAG